MFHYFFWIVETNKKSSAETTWYWTDKRTWRRFWSALRMYHFSGSNVFVERLLRFFGTWSWSTARVRIFFAEKSVTESIGEGNAKSKPGPRSAWGSPHWQWSKRASPADPQEWSEHLRQSRTKGESRPKAATLWRSKIPKQWQEKKNPQQPHLISIPEEDEKVLRRFWE